MITIQQIRNGVGTYIRSQPREVRFLCFFAALALVWMQADNIESFVLGFFDGFSGAGYQ